MRHQYIVIFLLFITFLSEGKPLSFSELMSESKKIRKDLIKEKSFDKKVGFLKSLEEKLINTMKTYHMQNPEEASPEEDKVASLYYSFEPLFDLIKGEVTEKKCIQTAHQISLEDQNLIQQNHELSIEAKEAILLLKLFCK